MWYSWREKLFQWNYEIFAKFVYWTQPFLYATIHKAKHFLCDLSATAFVLPSIFQQLLSAKWIKKLSLNVLTKRDYTETTVGVENKRFHMIFTWSLVNTLSTFVIYLSILWTLVSGRLVFYFLSPFSKSLWIILPCSIALVWKGWWHAANHFNFIIFIFTFIDTICIYYSSSTLLLSSLFPLGRVPPLGVLSRDSNSVLRDSKLTLLTD